MESSPSNVPFRRNFIDHRQESCNALLQRLDFVHLMQGFDEFLWNRNESGKFSGGSMYKYLIQPDVSLDNNKKKWKMHEKPT
jgi:hypothetical protein